MAVPYIFANATASIPLSQLDNNFATAITLGNASLVLGNTTTTVGNLTLTNVTVNSVSTPITVAQGGTGLTSIPHTMQVFTTGSGTYTSPANVKAIIVEGVGGGGGGAGSGTGSPGGGTAGGNTTFDTLTAVGGSAGSARTGGTASNGDVNLTGGVGGSGGGNPNTPSGPGGGTFMGPGAPIPAVSGNAGLTAAANSGGGGSGGSTATGANGNGGGGGGYFRKMITPANATYTYAVGAGGAGGAAGTSGTAGGAGGSGIIIVTEFYV
jgi:hypothetical protein